MPLDSRYFGEYAHFSAPSKDDGFYLVGADNIVGDVYTIEFVTTDNETLAWLVNRFDRHVGFFDANVSRRLSIMNARGWTIRAILSYVAFTTDEESGFYWGEAAIIANDPHFDKEVGQFVHNIAGKLGRGVRLDIDLGTNGVDQLIDSGGEWLPSRDLGKPKLEKGTALAKDDISFSDKMVEEARKNNPGCYVGGLVMIAAFVAAVVFSLKACGVM